MTTTLTPAQRAVLEKLARGQCIDTVMRRPKFLYGPYINRGTWSALCRKGFVRPNGITDAGRAALKAEARS